MAKKIFTSDSWSNFVSGITSLKAKIDSKANSSDLTSHTSDKSNPHEVTAEQVGAVPITRTINDTPLSDNITLTAADVGAEVGGTVRTHNTSTDAHNDIRVLISDLSTAVNNFLDVDDETTDQLSEVLILIENNRGTLESLTTSKVNVSDIINDLTTNVSNKPLSAAQGVAIKALIDALQAEVDTKATTTALNTHVNNKSNPHGVTLSQLGVTATAAELNIMDGVTATTTELNYVDGVTSNVQTQLNSKVNRAGDTMGGALNLANGTWNKAGDDVYFGDNNTAGAFAIKGQNGNTNLKMVSNSSDSKYATIVYDSTNECLNFAFV